MAKRPGYPSAATGRTAPVPAEETTGETTGETTEAADAPDKPPAGAAPEKRPDPTSTTAKMVKTITSMTTKPAIRRERSLRPSRHPKSTSAAETAPSTTYGSR